MLKHTIGFILLSILVVLTATYLQQGLQWMVTAYEWIAENLMQIFSGGEAGNLIRKLIALLVLPLLVGLIPSLIYWLIRRKWFPYFVELVWITWLVQTTALIVVAKI